MGGQKVYMMSTCGCQNFLRAKRGKNLLFFDETSIFAVMLWGCQIIENIYMGLHGGGRGGVKKAKKYHVINACSLMKKHTFL